MDQLKNPDKFPKIFVIILNYNGQATLGDCLKSVFRSDYPNLEVIVIDNDSTDGSFEKAKHDFSKAYFILNSCNLGFAKGNNVGIRLALERNADYIFVLNNDATIQPDTLRLLAAEMEKNEKIGILSPLIKKGDGKSIWFAGGEISWMRMRAQHTPNKNTEKLSDTQYVTGCAMLIRKEVFKSIGLFDENFFLYYEDADFCLRAKQHGFRSAVLKSVSIKHFEKSEQNMEQKNYWLVISGLKFFKKNTPNIWKPWVACYLIARKIKNSLDIFGGKNPMAITVKKAYKDYLQWEKR